MDEVEDEENVMEENDEKNGGTGMTKAELKKKKKNKGKQKRKQLLKKESRELRLKTMSEGLDVFQFSSMNITNGTNETDSMKDNEAVVPAEEINGTSKHKRVMTENVDVTNISKRKKRCRN